MEVKNNKQNKENKPKGENQRLQLLDRKENKTARKELEQGFTLRFMN